jgi:hypothetical protein
MKLICTQCGADGEIGCECGVAYIAIANKTPKAAQVAEALKDPANAVKSDRVIAAELGVGNKTVSRVRRATVSFDTVAKRVGKDGKARKSPSAKPALKLVPRVNFGEIDIGTEPIRGQPVQLMPATLQRLRDCKMRVETVAARVDLVAKFDLELFEQDVTTMLVHQRGGHDADRDFAKDANKALALIEGDIEGAISALVKLREAVKGKVA